MYKKKQKDTSFYESLSDLSMATLGIFIVFFVINLVFLKSDVIMKASENKNLKEKIDETKREMTAYQNNENKMIADFIAKNQIEIDKVQSQIEYTSKINEKYKNDITQTQQRIKRELNVDEVISVEDVRKILEDVKLKRKKVEEELKTVMMKMNNVRQEFNKYVEVENSYPYLEIQQVQEDWVMLDNEWIPLKQFKAFLNGINAGSGFTFRMKNNKPAPDYFNDILVQEGWYPIIDR